VEDLSIHLHHQQAGRSVVSRLFSPRWAWGLGLAWLGLVGGRLNSTLRTNRTAEWLCSSHSKTFSHSPSKRVEPLIAAAAAAASELQSSLVRVVREPKQGPLQKGIDISSFRLHTHSDLQYLPSTYYFIAFLPCQDPSLDLCHPWCDRVSDRARCLHQPRSV
jgi:hypothetical protein